jgi:hypothetical protein
MPTARKPIYAAHPSAMHTEDPDENTLTALTDGPRSTGGRSVTVRMTDAEVRGVIARLVLDPRWYPALESAVRSGFPMGYQTSAGERDQMRLSLCRRMATAMARSRQAANS